MIDAGKRCATQRFLLLFSPPPSPRPLNTPTLCACVWRQVEQGGGSVVSLVSDAGRIGEFREVVYSGTKAGVIAMTKALAKEEGRNGLRFNCVAPGKDPALCVVHRP